MTASEKKEPLVRIYGRLASPEAYRLRDFLHRCDVPFEFIALDSDGQARADAKVAHAKDPRLPVCEFPDGTRMECPSIRQVTEKLGWFANPSREEYDLAIYGAGPAGLSAAVYASADGLKTVLVERWAVGARQRAAPASRTISAFQTASPARSSPSVRASRRASSARRSSSPARACARSWRRAKASATWRTARR